MIDTSAHIIVSGLVQGVGYRFFAARNAERLAVTGYARNLRDGRVEIVACGERGRIVELVAVLRVGPRASRVTDVALEWMPSTESFERFEIR